MNYKLYAFASIAFAAGLCQPSYAQLKTPETLTEVMSSIAYFTSLADPAAMSYSDDESVAAAITPQLIGNAFLVKHNARALLLPAKDVANYKIVFDGLNKGECRDALGFAHVYPDLYPQVEVNGKEAMNYSSADCSRNSTVTIYRR
ncbi:hypothetical protein AS026_28660 [Rhizobium altiplani]|uniref:Uncharacterized protein n=1 Tax=Rhizobium altiplani TaxID=1864509 RepID=A0A125QA44_9HYPH|nr:hypothetical protein [Rhizobium altiplani]KWV59360.1 hypothetical protein AS026_28660 [Rhizobium altiplani]